jgi:hypothetical protein
VAQDPSLRAIDGELLRIGFERDDLPSLVLPSAISIGAFLVRLRDIPTGAGPKAFEELMRSLPWPRPGPWDEWPDPGDRFTLDDYVSALRLVNFSPLDLAEEYVTPPRRVPTSVFALLSFVSPELEARVAEFVLETRRERLQSGVSPEVVEMADEQFERARQHLSERLRDIEAEKKRANGPAVLFRLGPEVSQEEASRFFHEALPPELLARRAWLAETDAQGTWGCLFLPNDADVAERQRMEQWLQRQRIVREVRLSPVWVWGWP